MRTSLICLAVAIALVISVVPVSSEYIAVAHTWGTPGQDAALCIDVDFSGNVYIGGQSRDPSTDQMRGFLAKFNQVGTLIWDRFVTSSVEAGVFDLDVNLAGDVYVLGYSSGSPSGTFYAKVMADGSLSYVKALPSIANPTRIATDPTSGGFIIIGDTEGYGGGTVIAVRDDGTIRWAVTGQVYDIASAWAVAPDASGSIFAFIDRSGGADVGIVKLSSSGEVIAQRLLVSPEFWEYTWDLAVDPSGDVFALGAAYSEGELLLIRFTNSLDVVWMEHVGSPHMYEDATRLVQVTDGSLYAVGQASDYYAHMYGAAAYHFLQTGELVDSALYVETSEALVNFADAVALPSGGVAFAGVSYGMPSLVPIPVPNATVLPISGTWIADYVQWTPAQLAVQVSDVSVSDADAVVDEYPLDNAQAWFGFTIAPELSASIVCRPVGSAGTTFSFRATASGGVKPYAYEWSFGDGGTASGKKVSHEYSSPGMYQIALLVQDSSGKFGVGLCEVRVMGPPTIDSVFWHPIPAISNASVYFDADAYDPDGGLLANYYWDFGDGTSAVTSQGSVEHVYSTAGTYTLALTVTDDEGETASTAYPVEVVEVVIIPPVASFYYWPYMPEVGTTVHFDGNASYDPDGWITRYAWDFGDGTAADGVYIEHVFSYAGTYNVTLTVTDNLGATGWASDHVNVQGPATGDDYEPDNVYTDANPIVPGEAQAHSIHDGGADVDWATFSLTEELTIRVWTTLPAGGDTVMWLYGSTGVPTYPIAFNDDYSGLESQIVMALQPATYWVKVGAYESQAEIPTYYLSLDMFVPGDEPDLVVTSITADMDGTYVVVENQGNTSVSQEFYVDLFIDPTMPPTLGMYGDVYTNMSWLPAGSSTTVVFPAMLMGMHTLYAIVDTDMWILESNEGNNILGPVVVNIELPPAVPDDYEPDDTWDQASGILPGTSQAHSIHDGGADVDWVQFVLTEMATVTVMTSGTYGDTMMYLYDAGGVPSVPLAQDDNSGPGDWSMIRMTDLVAGTYYVKVEEAGLDAEIFAYSLSLILSTGMAEWTFLMYLDGDNNLEEVASADFMEMASVGTTGNVNIVVQFDRTYGYDSMYGDWTDTRRFLVLPGMTPMPGNEIEQLGELNMGDWSTLRDFVTWGITAYPAERYAVVLWDHGGGWAGAVCWDETNGFDALTLDEVERAISNASDETGARIDLLGYDACLMGMAEVAYETIEYVDVVVASEEVVPWDGWPYDTILADLAMNPTMSEVDLGACIVNRYIEYYGTSGLETQSCVDMVAAGSMYVSLEILAQELIIGLETYRSEIADSRSYTDYFADYTYVDLYDFAYELTLRVPDGNLRRAAQDLISNISWAVTAEAHGYYHSDAHGLSIYFPSYIAEYWSEYANILDFTADYSWDEFLGAYLAAGPDAYEPDDNYTLASAVSPGERQVHSIHNGGTDVDWVTFTLNGTIEARIWTSGPSYGDTEMWLFDSTGVPYSAIAYNDNYGGSAWSMIQMALEPGTYYVKVGSYGSWTEISEYYIEFDTGWFPNEPPVAYFYWYPSPVVGYPTYFDASPSYDPDGSIVSYVWDFGDGTGSSGIAVEHVYNETGEYLVTLTVTDDDGASSLSSIWIWVSIPSEPDAYEPDDTYLDASPISADETQEHSIHNGGMDVDWVTFTVTETTVVRIRTMGPLYQWTDTVIWLYDSVGVPDYPLAANDDTNGTLWSMLVLTLPPGTYYVMVNAYGYSQEILIYNLTLEMGVIPNLPPFAFVYYYTGTPYPVVGQPVYFYGGESFDQDGYITSYYWDFGDGVTSADYWTEHTYSAPGTYTVTLTVTDNGGLSTNRSEIITVSEYENLLPYAYIYCWPYNITVGSSVYFDIDGSYDPDGYLVSCIWDLGDGTVVTGAASLTHVYASAGEYYVTLTVVDNMNATSTAGIWIHVSENQPPVAVLSYSPQNPVPNEWVDFSAIGSYDPEGMIDHFEWDFGDGSSCWTWWYNASTQYAEGGDYTVTLTVVDIGGLTASDSVVVHVDLPPVPVITPSVDVGKAGTPVTFDGTASWDAEGPIVSYLWDLGDGTSCEGPVVSHTYLQAGTYSVSLWVCDSYGYCASTSMPFPVVQPVGPVAIAGYTPSMPSVGQLVAFDGSYSVDPDGSIVTWIWQFGDGGVATGESVTHIYEHSGTYSVKLTVIDEDNLVDEDVITITVASVPVADFAYSPASPMVGGTVTFYAVGSYDESGIREYVWSFGDDAYAQGWQATHTYESAGAYSVTLTITNNYGTQASATEEVVVHLEEVPSELPPGNSEPGEKQSLILSAIVTPPGIIICVLAALIGMISAAGTSMALRLRECTSVKTRRRVVRRLRLED